MNLVGIWHWSKRRKFFQNKKDEDRKMKGRGEIVALKPITIEYNYKILFFARFAKFAKISTRELNKKE